MPTWCGTINARTKKTQKKRENDEHTRGRSRDMRCHHSPRTNSVQCPTVNINQELVNNQIISMKTKTASGPDEIPAELINNGTPTSQKY